MKPGSLQEIQPFNAYPDEPAVTYLICQNTELSELKHIVL
jgi:hypothetical protein